MNILKEKWSTESINEYAKFRNGYPTKSSEMDMQQKVRHSTYDSTRKHQDCKHISKAGLLLSTNSSKHHQQVFHETP